ncbi:helix-turn-helix domain-containing protein [Okeania sp. SIO1I7]|uniref:helix-turn-helix domain-containing protein n=1 Tax=Okeania sp. SIO1I7 TaxID=2607772 RepID=UPI0013F7996C|nr:helix-turn-helix domain-containing protein [Okeania sp. SIO1I7]
MIITHCYKTQPTCEQSVKIDYWLELLRRHYNYALGQRLDWLNRTRCQVDPCSLDLSLYNLKNLQKPCSVRIVAIGWLKCLKLLICLG